MGGNSMNRRVPGRILSWWDQKRSRFTNWYIFRRELLKKIWIILLNNITMLLYHLLILVITIVVCRTFIFTPDAIYIENTIYIQIWYGFWYIFPLFLYFFAGYILKLTKNAYTDFASVLLFGLIGIFLWIYCMMHPTKDYQYLFYYLYTISTFVSGAVFFNLEGYQGLYLLTIIVPLSLCFFGLELRRYIGEKARWNRG
jgi:hypothetical protein